VQRARDGNGQRMYIGVGTILFIILIVLLIAFVF
jgi:DMSO/TMAO reductase YedYZ heme-binding membrane subunit